MNRCERFWKKSECERGDVKSPWVGFAQAVMEFGVENVSLPKKEMPKNL